MPGCPKWCSGELNKESQLYQYYLGWKRCVDALSFDMNPTGLVHKDALNNCWENWNIRIGQETNKNLYDINLGKECLQDTGCFFTSHGVGSWRSVERGIMFGNAGTYGSLGERAIENRINKYLSGNLVPQQELFSIDLVEDGFETYTHNRFGAFYSSPGVIYTDEFNENDKIIGGKELNLFELSPAQKSELRGRMKGKTFSKGINGEIQSGNQMVLIERLGAEDLNALIG